MSSYMPVFARVKHAQQRNPVTKPPSQASNDPDWVVPAWNQSMKKAKLLSVARRRGIQIPENVMKPELISLLEDHDAARFPSSIDEAMRRMK